MPPPPGKWLPIAHDWRKADSRRQSLTSLACYALCSPVLNSVLQLCYIIDSNIDLVHDLNQNSRFLHWIQYERTRGGLFPSSLSTQNEKPTEGQLTEAFSLTSNSSFSGWMLQKRENKLNFLSASNSNEISVVVGNDCVNTKL